MDIYKLVEDLTQDIIEQYDIKIPIRNIFDIVRKLGGHVEKVYVQDATGATLRKDGDSFIIYDIIDYEGNSISNNNPYCVAADLGHLFLHMGYKINSAIWNKYEDKQAYKSKSLSSGYQAGLFALALLMPEKEFRQVVDKYTEGREINTPKVAEYFNVSVSVAHKRLVELGIVKDYHSDVIYYHCNGRTYIL